MKSFLAWRLKYLVGATCFALIATLTAASGVDRATARDGQEVRSEETSATSSGIRDEIDELKRQISLQQAHITEQQRQIETLQLILKGHLNSAGTADASNALMEQPVASAAHSQSTGRLGEVASTMPIIPAIASSQPVAPSVEKPETQERQPLSFQIGTAYITPVGFMDLTSVFRSTAPGSGIGTNFGSIPYKNTTQGNLTEFRMSGQNSRIGSRVDVNVKDTHVLGYWESDFLGFVPANAAVSSNSDTFRLRLYWVDVRKDKWEFLGGQSWSMITPGRKGISPLPGDLFYTQVIDVNYQPGLTWSRNPQFRLVYHPSDSVAMGISFESPEQYIGGSAGGGSITLPSALVTAYASQLNNGVTTLSVPGLHPDIIGKITFDSNLPNGHGLHFELGGMVRTFKVWNSLSSQSFSTQGIGGQANLNIEISKGFRFVTNNFWSNGGGRYIFGQAPDLVVRSDGSLSPVHSASTVSGFEYTHNNTLLYAYYGGIYISRNTAIDSATGRYVGYGYPDSPNSQNKSIQEATFGFTQTFWKDARYGALSLMGQYSYLIRSPWTLVAGHPANANTNMILLNLRYAVPGSAPAMKMK
jgi:hypothetical protein